MANYDYGDFEPIPADLLPHLSPTEREAYETALYRHTARLSPLDFAQAVSPKTKEYATVRLLNSVIVALVEYRLYKSGIGPKAVLDEDGVPVHPETGERCMLQLFVTKPPRHGKSYIISEHTPAWYLTRYPDRNVLFSSYEADFAHRFGRRNRDHLIEHGDRLGVKLNSNVQARDEWETADKGGMKTAGAGGSITGRGGHLMVCDDPIKNSEDAESEVERKKLEGWWPSTWESRQEPWHDENGEPWPAVFILVHTRWHEADLGGKLTEEDEEHWFRLNLPALQPPETVDDTGLHDNSGNPLNRAAGEPLVPQRYKAAELEKRKKANPRNFEALYQQNPSVEGSGLFRRPNFKYWTAQGTKADPIYLLHDTDSPTQPLRFVPAAECFHYQTIDTATSEKTRADFTVISTWALTPAKDLLLVDRLRRRIDSAEHLSALQKELARLKMNGIVVRWIGVENKSFGISLIKQGRKRRLPVRPIEVDTDKYTRAIPAGDAVDSGWVYWPREAEWLPVWEKEHLQFPVSEHDDQVDTTSMAVHSVIHGGLGRIARKPEREASTLQERVDAKFEEMRRRKRKTKRHPVLGRL